MTAPGFQGAADARVSITGRLVRVLEDEKAAARDRYRAVHPDAFWVDYGDFSFWKMSEVVAVRLVGGFGRAGSIPPKLYAAARPDPVAGLGKLVEAANAHGSDAWEMALRCAVGVDADLKDPQVVSMDRLGLNLTARRGDAMAKVRLPFCSPADTPDAVHARVEALLSARP